MKSQALLILITVSIGILIGVAIGREPERPTSPSGPSQTETPATPLTVNPASPPSEAVDAQNYGTAIAQLKDTLAQEQILRQMLEKQVAALADKLDAMTESKTGTGNAENARPEKITRTGKRATPDPSAGWINPQLLVDAGMVESDVKRVTDLYETMEMDRLVLRDQAMREGWMGSDRFRNEMDNLDQRVENLRNDLGDGAYDALLYASGRPNRVYVSGTLGNSPAAQAGIQAGDAILRYAGERIYSWTDLRQATGKGDANEVVPVEIDRNNKRLEIYVKRGPLGVRLDQQSVKPNK